MAKKRIKDLTNTATEADLVEGNYLALDGAGGTKKLPADIFPKQFYIGGIDKPEKSIKPDSVTLGYYYNFDGSRSDYNIRYSSAKFFVSPLTYYSVRASMYGNMCVCEFDENDVFIKSHKISLSFNEHYDKIDFKTARNCAYIMVGTDNTYSDKIFVFNLLAPYKVVEDVRGLDEAFLVSENYTDAYNGYYDRLNAFHSASDIVTYKVSVKPMSTYVVVGDLFGYMSFNELTSSGKFIRSNQYSGESSSRQVVKTTETTAFLYVTTRITNDFDKPLLFIVSNDEILDKEIFAVKELIADSSEIGYAIQTGSVTSSDEYICKKFEVSQGRKFRATGYFWGAICICEYDENDSFVAYHKRWTYSIPANSIDFVTRPNTKYVRVSSWLTKGIDAKLYDIGFNNLCFPLTFYGVEGIQKNIYCDRFGLSDFGSVNLIPSPNEDNSSQTRMHNRIEYNVSSYGTKNLKIFASVSGESSYGDDFAPTNAVVVKFLERKNPSSAKNILWVGDSISDYQNTAKFVKQAMEETAGGIVPSFVGTRHTTGTPDESYAGRDTYWLMTNEASPFVSNGSVDFEEYNSTIGVSGIDICVMSMGFNDSALFEISRTITFEQMKQYYIDFVEKITTANPSIKIVWVLPPFSSHYEKMRDGNSHRIGIVKLRNLVMWLAHKYSNVIASDAFYCIDSINGYPLSQVPIASVYSSLSRTQDFCSDSTHPTELGCKEWALSVYGAILEALT